MKADSSPTAPSESEAAANRRWLITIVITVVFGCFGAVMAYLSYANNDKSSAPSTGSSRSSGTPPGTAPTTAPTVAPPVAEPTSDEDARDKPGRGKPDTNK